MSVSGKSSKASPRANVSTVATSAISGNLSILQSAAQEVRLEDSLIGTDGLLIAADQLSQRFDGLKSPLKSRTPLTGSRSFDLSQSFDRLATEKQEKQPGVILNTAELTVEASLLSDKENEESALELLKQMNVKPTNISTLPVPLNQAGETTGSLLSLSLSLSRSFNRFRERCSCSVRHGIAEIQKRKRYWPPGKEDSTCNYPNSTIFFFRERWRNGKSKISSSPLACFFKTDAFPAWWWITLFFCNWWNYC
jgi:hypothetical protein